MFKFVPRLLFTNIAFSDVCKIVEAKDNKSPATANTIIIDVRSAEEVRSMGTIPYAIHIPVQIIRDVLSVAVNECKDQDYHRSDNNATSEDGDDGGDDDNRSGRNYASSSSINSSGMSFADAYAHYSTTPATSEEGSPIPTPDPKKHTLLMYCHAGVRSLTAADIAEEMGFRVLHYPEGMMGWMRQVNNSNNTRR